MRHTVMALLLWMACGLAQAAGPEVGQPAPTVLGKARDGTPVSLEQFRGRIVVVSFWASWCKYCLKELPVLDSLQRHGQDLLQVVAVNVKDTPEDYRVMMRQMKSYQLLQARDTDGRIAEQYAVTGYPSLWIIDREGRIAARYQGYDEGTLEVIIGEINALLRNGGTVNPG